MRFNYFLFSFVIASAVAVKAEKTYFLPSNISSDVWNIRQNQYENAGTSCNNGIGHLVGDNSCVCLDNHHVNRYGYPVPLKPGLALKGPTRCRMNYDDVTDDDICRYSNFSVTDFAHLSVCIEEKPNATANPAPTTARTIVTILATPLGAINTSAITTSGTNTPAVTTSATNSLSLAVVIVLVVSIVVIVITLLLLCRYRRTLRSCCINISNGNCCCNCKRKQPNIKDQTERTLLKSPNGAQSSEESSSVLPAKQSTNFNGQV